jgi:hypothetical protein
MDAGIQHSFVRFVHACVCKGVNNSKWKQTSRRELGEEMDSPAKQGSIVYSAVLTVDQLVHFLPTRRDLNLCGIQRFELGDGQVPWVVRGSFAAHAKPCMVDRRRPVGRLSRLTLHN